MSQMRVVVQRWIGRLPVQGTAVLLLVLPSVHAADRYHAGPHEEAGVFAPGGMPYRTESGARAGGAGTIRRKPVVESDLRLSVAWDINNGGKIAGLCLVPHGQPHVCLWDRGALIDTGIVSSSFLSATINERGQVLTITACEGGMRAVLWERGELRSLGDCVHQAWGWDLSNSGQAVWNSSSLTSDHAVIWKEGRTIDLSHGFLTSAGNNDGGQVAGVSPSGGFLWDNGAITPLGRWFQPTNLNNRGQVIGYLYQEGDEGDRAGIWENGVATRLEPLPGHSFDQAWGINERGQVVGASQDYAHGSAVLWERGRVTELVPDAMARSINNRGQVLGDARTGSFFWDRGSVTYFGGYAWAMNDHGQVVGTVRGANDEDRAFLWENGVMIDLDSGHVIPPLSEP